MGKTPVRLTTPVKRDTLRSLKAGDAVAVTGEFLVFRDQAHRLLAGLFDEGGEAPFELAGRMLYYCGPTPARDGMAVGSAGPTTSSRMDRYTGMLLERGLAATIGKGGRSPEVVGLMRRHEAVYFVATGGAGALLAKHITASRVVAFPELGTEAARIFSVVEFPLIVGIDSRGESAFAGM